MHTRFEELKAFFDEMPLIYLIINFEIKNRGYNRSKSEEIVQWLGEFSGADWLLLVVNESKDQWKWCNMSRKPVLAQRWICQTVVYHWFLKFNP